MERNQKKPNDQSLLTKQYVPLNGLFLVFNIQLKPGWLNNRIFSNTSGCRLLVFLLSESTYAMYLSDLSTDYILMFQKVKLWLAKLNETK